MKPRALTRFRGLQLVFGAFLPTLWLLPYLFLLFVNLVVTPPRILSGQPPNLQLLMWSVGGLGGLASLWIVVLFGAEQVCRSRYLRWFTIVTGLLGLWTAFFLLIETFPSVTGLVLIGPLLIGLGYLPALLGSGKASLRGTLILVLIALVLALFIVPLGRF